MTEHGYEAFEDEDDLGRDVLVRSATPTQFYTFGESWPISNATSEPSISSSLQPATTSSTPAGSSAPKLYKSEASIMLNIIDDQSIAQVTSL